MSEAKVREWGLTGDGDASTIVYMGYILPAGEKVLVREVLPMDEQTGEDLDAILDSIGSDSYKCYTKAISALARIRKRLEG